jgi:RimJ/RimL family protein N-acetyltransferase
VSESAWIVTEPLLTERLELRVHRLSDLDDLVIFHGDTEVTRYIPWPVRTREETRVALEAKLAQGSARLPGEWIVLAIVLRESSTVIGEVLLKRGDIAGTLAEVGYVVRADMQGRGLASEAVGGILSWARELGVTSIIAMVDARNSASSRLLARLGFARDPDLDQEHDEEVVLGYRLALSPRDPQRG